MTAGDLVWRLESAGVRLWHEDGLIRFDGPAGTVTDEVLDELRSHRDAVAALLAERGPEVVRVLPAAMEQQRIWRALRHLAHPEVWLNCFYVDVGTRLHVGALQTAMDKMIARHELLRTAITDRDGQAVLTVLRSAEAPVRTLPGDDLEAECRAFAAELDFARPPLTRLAVVRGTDILVLAAHHIITDGVTMDLFGRELGALYREALDGIPARLPPAEPFSSFADRERVWSQAHRREALAARTAALGDPVKPLVSADDGGVSSSWLPLPADDGPALRAVAQRMRVPVFAVMAAACAIQLRELTGRATSIIGMSADSRSDTEQHTIGLLRRHLPIRVEVRSGDTWRSLVRRCADEVFQALRWPLLSCDDVERSWLGSDAGQHVFPQVLLTHLPGFSLGIDMGAGFVPWDEFVMAGSRCPLTLEITSGADGVRIGMEAAAGLVGRSTIQRLMERYAELLRDCAARLDGDV
ncbi:condensation domain-containing protein [Kutzneria sp. NPDC052558]|uniref:condensation domain-containing protein n=1 Tax=Kutzneria sp. NPDC052558 TaxID=3364121 RepID=UPI0037CA5D27